MRSWRDGIAKGHTQQRGGSLWLTSTRKYSLLLKPACSSRSSRLTGRRQIFDAISRQQAGNIFLSGPVDAPRTPVVTFRSKSHCVESGRVERMVGESEKGICVRSARMRRNGDEMEGVCAYRLVDNRRSHLELLGQPGNLKSPCAASFDPLLDMSQGGRERGREGGREGGRDGGREGGREGGRREEEGPHQCQPMVTTADPAFAVWASRQIMRCGQGCSKAPPHLQGSWSPSGPCRCPSPPSLHLLSRVTGLHSQLRRSALPEREGLHPPLIENFHIVPAVGFRTRL
jgi:hypothetical protein